MLCLCVKIIYVPFRLCWKLLFFNKGLINESAAEGDATIERETLRSRRYLSALHVCGNVQCLFLLFFFSFFRNHEWKLEH